MTTIRVIGVGIGLDEDEINIVWWLTPILMRPHPHTSFNDCDVIIDFPRNILWIVFYMLLFHSLDYPDINIFSAESTTEWPRSCNYFMDIPLVFACIKVDAISILRGDTEHFFHPKLFFEKIYTRL